MGLRYHRTIFWRPEYDKEVETILDNYSGFEISRHCLDRIADHAGFRVIYNDFEFLDIYKYMQGYLFEVETDDDGHVFKFVIRREYNTKYDVTVVFSHHREDNRIVLVTAWINSVSDKHKGLDHNLYEKE